MFNGDKIAAWHYQELTEGSGIDPEVIGERGYHSVGSERSLGHFPKPVQQLVPGLMIPSWTIDGEPGPPQYKPDEPRIDGRSKKPIKYETQARVKLRLDVHPRNSPQKLYDVKVPLYITEGFKKADSGTSRGLCVIALTGVDCWQQGGEPLPDWAAIPLAERIVYLLFDSDAMTKKEVRRALRKLKRFLESKGAIVRIVNFQPNGNKKVGLDDYFVAGGTIEGLDDLVGPLPGEHEGAIVLTDLHLGDAIDAVLAYLDNRNDRLGIYQRGGALIEPGPEGEYIAVTPDRMLYHLGRAPLYTLDRSGDQKPSDPPAKLVAGVLNAREEWPFPTLGRVIRSPVFNADGSLHSEPGYDERTRTLYLADPTLQLLPEVSEEPSDAEVSAAVRLLAEELLIDFPFETPADRANALALLIEPLIRDMIDGQTPFYGINAYNPGTGKGLLADVCLVPALGRSDSIPPFSDVTSDAEMRKKITAAGIAARQVFFLDNVNYKLAYSSLAAALTRPTISDRILGVSRDVVLRLRWTWLAIGNHLKYSDEIQRRVVPINLAARDENPHLRTGFRHELPAWAIENRHRLIGAVVVLVRRWLAEGRPGPGEDVPAFGSFGAWRDTLGGILGVAGSTSFLRNLVGFEAHVSRERVLLAVFVRAAIEEFYDKDWSPEAGLEQGQFGAKEAKSLDVASELVPDVDPDLQERKFTTQLGLWLSRNHNRPVSLGERGRWWFVPDGADSKRGTALYRLKRIG